MYSDSNEKGLKFELGVAPTVDSDHRGFWGDEFNWTSLLRIAWKNIETPGISIRPILASKSPSNPGPDVYSAASYWSAAIHLLGLGMGWTNIGEGLRLWRETGYRKGQHPILDFIARSYGTDVYSLELYFAAEPRWGLFRSLSEMGERGTNPNSEPGPKWQSLDYDWKNVGYLESLKAKSRKLAKQLLDGGSDALHLERHVVESFMPQGLEYSGRQLTQLSEFKFHLSYACYAGWAHNLSRETKLSELFRSENITKIEIRVEINSLGELGSFAFDTESGRWFMFSNSYGAHSLQQDSHRWGNPR